jgi:predicted NAD/FAD-binding protein
VKLSVASDAGPPKSFAVIGSGISGLVAAWLLARRHHVTLYETEERVGGHSCTVEALGRDGPIAVDMGFMVFNETAYPNLMALLAILGVETRKTCMSLGISLDGGALEYGSRGLCGLLAQPTNLLRPRFLTMMRDVVRFYRECAREVDEPALAGLSLGDYLDLRGYSEAFQTDHLLPQVAAIWSAPIASARNYPVGDFVRFFANHGLLQLVARPEWRTVVGGAKAYVDRLMAQFDGTVLTGCGVARISRTATDVQVHDSLGRARRFDQVVIATHADQALAMLDEPSAQEQALLGAIRYTANQVVLHTDPGLMPRRRAAWASWNYLGRRGLDSAAAPSVSYWMNRLQGVPGPPLIVSLNPQRDPAPGTVLRVKAFDHPIIDACAMAAQRRLWSLQGVQRTWFCGAYFGAGFHEDGLQAGLAVAEAIARVRRPWRVPHESGRIFLDPPEGVEQAA